MRKITAIPALMLTAILPLSACSSDNESGKGDATQIALEGKTVEQSITSGTTYGTLTFKADKPVETLWVKNLAKQEGTLQIDVCSKPWKENKCADGQVALAKVDLAGWEYDLATAGTQMSKGQSRHFRFITDAKKPLKLRWSVKQGDKPTEVK